MIGPRIESLIPDEVQNVCEEITGTVEAAYDVLLKRRDTAFVVAIAPLGKERESLEKERDSIAETAHNLSALLPAKEREAQRQADVLLLSGQLEAAQAKLAEMEEAKAAPRAMEARQREIDLRLTAIEEDRRAAARRVFEGWYGECQAVIRASEHGLFCTLLDGLKASFYEYQERTGTGGTIDQPYSFLVKDSHLENLTSDERTSEWTSASRWYSGRR
jgi:hypothetical protein